MGIAELIAQTYAQTEKRMMYAAQQDAIQECSNIVRQHFTKTNGQWTSAKAKACHDELMQMMKGDE